MGDLWIDRRPAWGVSSDVLGAAEGVAISRCGRMMAVAQAQDDRVAVFERVRTDGAYAARQVGTLGGPESGIHYPHDVDFSPDGRLLAVASRESSSVTFHAREPGSAVRFGNRPVWTIAGRHVRLSFTDAVKFVPPRGAFVAAANLARDSVTFYRRHPLRRARFGPRPCFALRGPETRLVQPDGLAFTADGRLLAVTNHGADHVTIYARRGLAPRFGPVPVAQIRGTPTPFRCPHSVAFSPSGSHLAISNAGGRTVTVYRRDAADPTGASWSDRPVLELEACDPGSFAQTNAANHREGGSKGVAFGADCFAVCNGEFGLRVHRTGTAGPGA